MESSRGISNIKDSRKIFQPTQSKWHLFVNKLKMRKAAVPIASVLGILCAFTIVIVWFPKESSMWNNPIQQIDAPSHYYFIRKLMKEGIGAAFHLHPNGSYYPPLFHILCAALLKVANAIGLNMSIYAALNTVWIVSSGIVFPMGMLFLCRYFFHSTQTWVSALLSVLVPILSVSSATHPYWMLSAGPLIAFGLATSMVPFLIYFSLRLLDSVASSSRNFRSIIKWSICTVIYGLIIIIAQPRIGFTYLLLILPFVVLRLPKKVTVSVAGGIILLGCAFAGFVYVSYPAGREKLFHPANWFSTFKPSRSLGEALRIAFTDFLPGIAGVMMAIALGCALIFSIIYSLNSEEKRRWDGIALSLDYLFVVVVYVSSTALTGAIPNILAGPWYRGETRTLTMLPLASVPLIAYATKLALEWLSGRYGRITRNIVLDLYKVAAICIALFLVLLSGVAQVANSTRADLSEAVASSTRITDENPDEQLTTAKYEVLADIAQRVGTDAPIISDPLNGSMYGMTIFGLNMVYPVYNPMSTGAGKIFADIETSFASGASQNLLKTVCPINGSQPKYFLTMGPQAPSLQMFTFKAQFDMFHDDELIDRYAQEGALEKIISYGAFSPKENWALYEFNCSD